MDGVEEEDVHVVNLKTGPSREGAITIGETNGIDIELESHQSPNQG